MKPKTEIILINISGDDKPGVTTALAEVLARYDAFILDIGQADIHQIGRAHVWTPVTEENLGMPYH